MSKSKIMLATMILIFTSLNLFGTDRNADTANYITIEGKILANDERLRDFTVLVYEGNDSLFQFAVSGKGFSVDLGLNKLYTIQLSKDGYFQKRIVVDTKLDASHAKEGFEILFETSVIPADQKVDRYYLDFPATIFRYNTLLGKFSMNENYTKFIKERLSLR